MTAYSRERVIERFGVPEAGIPVLEQILDETECAVICAWEGERMDGEALCAWLTEKGFCAGGGEARSFAERAWKRGVLWLYEDESYGLGSFYGRLDVFAVEERAVYQSFAPERREALDAWYFGAYVQGLREWTRQAGPGALPTGDRVLTLEEALAFVDGREDTPYLADCDCRVLKEGCGMPVRTCITYRTAENSFARKGLAAPITKEEAKEVIRRADAAGLMHTANPGGVCNCCGDCCYLFRASEALGLWGVWPPGAYRIAVTDACIGCGRCLDRCHFGVLALETGEDGKRRVRAEREALCVGCGICREVCPAGALLLKEENV